jgi:hypothetical protein
VEVRSWRGNTPRVPELTPRVPVDKRVVVTSTFNVEKPRVCSVFDVPPNPPRLDRKRVWWAHVAARSTVAICKAFAGLATVQAKLGNCNSDSNAELTDWTRSSGRPSC